MEGPKLLPCVSKAEDESISATHKTKPYDFLCDADGKDLFVEVKGTPDSGRSVSLTPNEADTPRNIRIQRCSLSMYRDLCHRFTARPFPTGRTGFPQSIRNFQSPQKTPFRNRVFGL